MCEPIYIEKECVGCGNAFLSPIKMSENNLYCTSNCEENHSIFGGTAENTKSETMLCN